MQTLTQSLGHYFNNQTKPIERLDLTQAAHKLGVKYADLYNAFVNGKDGRFVQRDPETRKAYVLATDIEPLRVFMEERKAGPVVQLTPKLITTKELAARVGMEPNAFSTWKAVNREHFPKVKPIKQGNHKLYPENIVPLVKAAIDKVGYSSRKQGVVLPKPVVKLKEKPPVVMGPVADHRADIQSIHIPSIQEVTKPLTWTTVAKELAAKFPEAALYVLTEKVEA